MINRLYIQKWQYFTYTLWSANIQNSLRKKTKHFTNLVLILVQFSQFKLQRTHAHVQRVTCPLAGIIQSLWTVREFKYFLNSTVLKFWYTLFHDTKLTCGVCMLLINSKLRLEGKFPSVSRIYLPGHGVRKVRNCRWSSNGDRNTISESFRIDRRLL